MTQNDKGSEREQALARRLELMAEIVHNGQHHQWNEWKKCDHPVCVETRRALEPQ